MAISSSKMLSFDFKPLLFSLIIIACDLLSVSQGQLKVGFHSQTCPTAESIVRQVVQKNVVEDRGNAAILLRLIFHDCFVEGCDASILLEVNNSEQQANGNLGVGGFGIIEEAKAALEGVCPGVVSCADIIALAARDAVSLMSGPNYEVPTGRRDGRVSRVELAANLPEVDDSIEVLKSKFLEKGLSDKDLVLLSAGAHTIGKIACFFMQRRLYNFTKSGESDPAISPRFLPTLKSECPPGDSNTRISLDSVTEFVFDNQIYRNIKDGFAVIASDARLCDDNNTKKIIDSYINLEPSFKADFAKAMVKMGNIGAKTGSEGEIRRVCSAVN